MSVALTQITSDSDRALLNWYKKDRQSLLTISSLDEDRRLLTFSKFRWLRGIKQRSFIMSTERMFDTKEHAAAYLKYRSFVPKVILRKICFFLDETFQHSNCVGVDIGCGSGQGTIPLSHMLNSMVGIDVSLAQIEEVKKRPLNVDFKIGSAENIPVPDKSVHLVTAVNAAHWFDLDKFYQEVDRILVPEGVVALIRGTPCIELKGCEKESMRLYDQLVNDTYQHWDQKSKFHDFLYKDVDVPYRKKVRDESVITEEKMTVSFLMGRVKTFSGIAKFMRTDREGAKKVLDKFENDILKAIGCPNGDPENTEIILKRQYVLLMGRK